MNEKERIEAYIANCKCCLLAQVMKGCPLCRFNIGLAEQVNLGNVISLPQTLPIPMHELREHFEIFAMTA
jgi:hypothetical protein